MALASEDLSTGVRTGSFNYLSKAAQPSLYRNGKVFTRRDHDGSDDHWEGVDLEPVEMPVRNARRLESSEGIKVALSDGEFDLLVAFAEHPQRVLSREQLLDLSRGRGPVPFDRSVDMQVGRLRRKIETHPEKPELIQTVRGRGYIFTPAVEKP